MAERLGEALLDLRTNDAGFTSGVEKAEGKAKILGAQLDRTKGSAAQLATEMVRTGQSASQMGTGFDQAGQRVTAAAGAQRQGMQQLSFQIGDIATMYSLGARPAQIFASQIGQVTQAVQMMSGGSSRLAAFLGGPWGIALTAATIVLAPFIGKLSEAEDALEGVEFASDNLGEAQSRLKSVIDTTTGAISRQRVELLELVRAQAMAAVGQARQEQARLRGELRSAANETEVMRDPVLGLPMFGGFPRGILRRRTDSAQVVSGALSGELTPQQATQRLSDLRSRGRLSEAEEIRLTSTIANLGVQGVNQRRAEAELRFYSGNATAADRQLLGIRDLIDNPSEGRGVGGRARGAGRAAGGARVRSEAEMADDFTDQSLAVERQTLQAKLQLATSADERADIQEQLLSLERDQRIAEVQASDLGPERKAALIAQIEALLGVAAETDKQGEMIVSANRGLEGQIIARERARQQAFDELDLADIRFRGEMEMLQNQMALADTQAAQKVIALRIYDAQVEEERIRLQKIIDLEAIGAVTKKEADDARARLAALNANAASGRAAVDRQNETEVERYMRLNINRTPAQINEAIDGITIDGLEALNDGLTDAIMGAESLGDVFSRVADQIIADLLRIAIQQAIIRPLANALFPGSAGGGGGGGGGLLGGLVSTAGQILPGILGGSAGTSSTAGQGVLMGRFVGGRAKGGPIPTGTFAVVGEEGPELAFAGPGGMNIVSNPDSRKLLASLFRARFDMPDPASLLSQSPLFAGGFARGGTIPTGKFAVVGEEGPELAFAAPGGLGIMSNPDSRRLLSGEQGGDTNISIPINIDATGADPAAIARLRAELSQLQADLPGRIVTTVREAGQRRVLNIGGGR